MPALLTLCGLMILLSGCAEVVQGPRYVPYTNDRFYIRHAPVVDGADGVDAIATGLCASQDRSAARVDERQWYFFDLRAVTYQCVDSG